MSPKPMFALVCLFAALGLGLVACGGDDDASLEDYESSIVEKRDRVDSAFGSISAAQSRQDFSDRMEQAAVVIGRVADDLDKEDRPEKFEDETDELEAALHQLSADLKGTAEQLRLTPELFDSPGLSFPGFTKANEVLRALGRQGIAVEPLANH